MGQVRRRAWRLLTCAWLVRNTTNATSMQCLMIRLPGRVVRRLAAEEDMAATDLRMAGENVAGWG